MASRVAASLLAAAFEGHDDGGRDRSAAAAAATATWWSALVATDLEAYADAMFRLATDARWYDDLRAALEAARQTSSLWDAQAYARHLTDGLVQAWEHHLSGGFPRDIWVPEKELHAE
jgi:hypothetical protein